MHSAGDINRNRFKDKHNYKIKDNMKVKNLRGEIQMNAIKKIFQKKKFRALAKNSPSFAQEIPVCKGKHKHPNDLTHSSQTKQIT